MEDVSIQEMNVEIEITLEDAEGNEVTEKVILNPKTGDPIVKYIIVFSISVVGCVTLIVLHKKGKLNKKILGLFIVVAILAPTVIYASTSSSLNFTGTINLNDKCLVTFVRDAERADFEARTVNYGDSVQVPAVEPDEGFEAHGWFDEDGHIYEDEIPNVTHSIVLYPNVLPIEYTIIYDLDGGSLEESIDTYTCISEDIVLPKPKKKGFGFVGWTGSNGETPEKQVVILAGSMGNKSYTANWVESTYETSREQYPTDQLYTFFGNEGPDWKNAGVNQLSFEWHTLLPTITFNIEVERARLGYSPTEYVTYNTQPTAAGFISNDQLKIWFSDHYGDNADGYYTLGYTQDSVDHELRFHVSGAEIVEIESEY